eukprot:g8055.t1
MANDGEQRGCGGGTASGSEAPTNGREAPEKRVRSTEAGVKLVPSVGETAETWSWLSTSLRNELQQDLDLDEPDATSLGDADIDLSPLKIVTSREVLQAKIQEALIYWDKLAERIPLKRHRPAGLCGKVAGSDDMFLDFDIEEAEVPRRPPDGGNEVHLYQYYVQRILCTVPRADWLRARTMEGRVPLRAGRVKAHLDMFLNKKPYGDRYLLKETNYAYKDWHRNVLAVEQAFSGSPGCGVSAEKIAGAARNGVNAGAAGTEGGTVTVDRGSVVTGAGHCGGVAGGEAAAVATAVTAAEGNISGNSGGGGGSGGGGARSESAASPATVWGAEGAVHRSFSGPSRAVVTFALYRSAAKGKGLKLQGHLPEKRLFEVEALEHNTLQQIMEAMPPCLADRIVEEHRAGAGDKGRGDGDEGASPRAQLAGKKCISLAGGFLFIRGVFYVTRPVEGEDLSHVPPPPPPESGNMTARAAPAPAGSATATEAAHVAPTDKRQRRQNAVDARETTTGGGSSQHHAGTPARTALPPAPPPEPWMKRWLKVGHTSWNTDKEELLKSSEKQQRHVAQAGQEQGNRAEAEEGEEEEEEEEEEGGETERRPRKQTKGRKHRKGKPRGVQEDGNEEREEEEWDPRASLEGAPAAAATPAGAVPEPAAASAPAERRTSGGTRDKAAGKGKGRGRGKKAKGKGKGKGKETGVGETRGAAATGARRQEEKEEEEGEGDEGEGDEEQEETGASDRAGGSPAAAGSSATPTSSRKRARAAAGKNSRPRAGAGAKSSNGDPELLARSMLGVSTRRKLGMAAEGGKVVWAADATVADLRPVLGERYVFLHNRVCDHLFVVSDIRMEPVQASVSPNNPAALPAAAAATTSPPVGGSATQEYPWLSFRAKPNSRRCGICYTKTAVKTSIGHPLSDKAPLACCEECFEMLYYDADQKPLEGELAGEVASAPPAAGDTGDRNAEQRQGFGGQAVRGPRGWKVFGCYDEH